MIDTHACFVLLDDPRTGATLFADPGDIVRADRIEDVAPALERIQSGVRAGRHAAGYVAYEAGHALDRAMPRRAATDGAPLLWFGLFDAPRRLTAAQISLLADPRAAAIGRLRPTIRPAAYRAAVGRIQQWIAAGDIYQANYTFPSRVKLIGAPMAVYGRIRRANVSWGGIVRTTDRWLLSASPESFFTLRDGTITARPMKGTIRRSAQPAEDAALTALLASDPKQRAENLMIVDLLRNDIARIAVPGTVEVPRLFEIETYPSLHQMTSTVTARLRPGLDGVDALRALFPCGSITGAPKIRAMQIIDAIEAAPRGIYTGSIGHIDPNGDAAFNVAIRTLDLPASGDVATLGLGSAIVADSDPAAEWRECLLKGRFLRS